MTVRVRCPNCDGALNVRREQLGKRGKCPKCGVPVVISEENVAPVGRVEQEDSEPESNPAVEVLSKTWNGLTNAFGATRRATGNLIRARSPIDDARPTRRPPTYRPPAQPVHRPVEYEETAIEYEEGTALQECPFCRETIKQGAKKCRYCGEIIDVVLRASQDKSQINITNTNNSPQWKRWSPLTAAFLSFIFPGLGQLYKGQPLNAFVWCVIVVLGYIFLIIPGMVLHLCCILGAASGDPYR